MTKNVWTAKKAARRLLPLSVIALLLGAAACSAPPVGNTESRSEKTVQHDLQIFKGKNAKHEDFPWQVSIGSTARDGDAFERHFCGGSLISDRWVLTAAHCLEDFPIKTLRVVHGATDLRRADGAETRKVVNVCFHPDYIGNPEENDGNDIALLRLSEPIDAPTSDAKLKLPETGDAEKFIFPNASAVVTGYGKTELAKNSHDLLAADVSIVDNSECREAYHPDYKVSEGELCVEPSEGGSCQGDSGGPLVVKGEGEEYLLAGVVSWGPTNCAPTEKYGVYARVSHFREWIRKTAQGQ